MSKINCGTLNDTEIKELSKNGKLIIENFNEENVKQACYELRAGDTYFDLSSNGARHDIEDGDLIIFKPHQTIVIMSKEKLELPNDILARFITKGYLFSIGFAPINTYADPGFSGYMGIVMNNNSNHYLKIKSGTAIAKIEFTKLQSPVENTYKGQHGFETNIWPIRNDLIINKNEIEKYFPNYDEIEEIRAAYGETVSNIIHRVIISERRFIFATTVLIIINLIIIGISYGTEWLSPITNVILGIVSNLIYAIVSFVINNYKSKRG